MLKRSGTLTQPPEQPSGGFDGLEPETRAETAGPGAFERHVVLVAPQVHWNTGNIGRTCMAVDAWLHLIKPLGFSLGSREVKRAGLDYWPRVKLRVWDSVADFLDAIRPDSGEVAVFTKNGLRSFREIPQKKRLFLIFGSETAGLPDSVLQQFPEALFFIPTTRAVRSLNLSTAAGIALYESLRCREFRHGWLSTR
ncbi:MAG: tRNA (cytidine(34)-2'-O)-methyltransferase [Thermodesulfobacteriota bacterium]